MISEETYNFNDWSFIALSTKSILPSIDSCKSTSNAEHFDKKSAIPCSFCLYQDKLKYLPQWPEMIFAKNHFTIIHRPSCARIDFKALDALLLVDNVKDWVKIQPSQNWAKARQNCEFIKNTIKPYDWTYSTSYAGSLSGFNKVSSTSARIDMQKLAKREQILFYQEIPFFEDELADNGCSRLTLKFRCMPSSFFVLLRFYLRVDRVLVKINDCRFFWETGRDFILREYSSRCKYYEEMNDYEKTLCMNENEISAHLDLTEEKCEKLEFY
uniref:TIP41-like protein n=1 Tax=Romanomermis culicivorax TaxID=13658 RepID=A0A915K878_ROMCU